MNTLLQARIFFLPLTLFLAGCVGLDTQGFVAAAPPLTDLPTQASLTGVCPVTQPAWINPPDDPAISDPPEYGFYFVNADRSILASAWWHGQLDFPLRAGVEGNKIGWFRPAGADLEISGQRLDGESPPLSALIPCCYPTRFQSTGLYFPTPGCWEVTARSAGSLLRFIVSVAP
jgi:hypothetical protein